MKRERRIIVAVALVIIAVMAGMMTAREARAADVFSIHGEYETDGYPIITWDPVSGTSSYAIYRCPSSSDPDEESAWGSPIAVMSSTATRQYKDTDTEVWKGYYYRVKAFAASGEKTTGHMIMYRKLTAPHITNAWAEAITGKPKMVWETVEKAAGYLISRKVHGDSEWTDIATLGSNVTEYTDTTAVLGVRYDYKLIARSGRAKSLDSTYEKIKVITCKPPCPNVTAEDSDDGWPLLTWDPVPGITLYRVIYRLFDSENGWTEVEMTDTSFEFVDADYGAKYSYTVYALGEDSSGRELASGADKTCSGVVTCAEFPDFTLHPKNRAVFANFGTLRLDAKCVGKDVVYDWYVKNPAESAWNYHLKASGRASYVNLTNLTENDDGLMCYAVGEDIFGRVAVSETAHIAVLSNPESVFASIGDSVTFSVSTYYPEYVAVYSWQTKAKGSDEWVDATGSGTSTSKLTVSVTASNAGSQYRCVIEDCSNELCISQPATLSVRARVTKQPQNQSVAVGDTAKFTVTTTGTGTLQYQWQYRKNSSSAWANSAQSGNKTATLSVATTAGLHGYQFRCVVRDNYGTQVSSEAATLTVKPKITTQPVDKSLLVGSTAKFTVAATGKGTLTYQWQYRKNSSSEWAASGQQGAKTDTLLVSTTAGLHGYQFRCVITDGNGQKSYTRAATLTLKPRITTQPADKNLLVNSTAKFTIVATGKGTLKYQWQYRKNEKTSWADSGQQGAKTDTLLVSATAGLHGYQFRCIVTDGNGQKSYSKTVTLTLKPRITTQPTDKSVTAGTKAKFTVVATGKSTLTYQWQFRKNSSCDWADSGQSGNKTATLSVATTKSLNGYQFRCIVTDGNGQKTISGIVTLTVK